MTNYVTGRDVAVLARFGLGAGKSWLLFMRSSLTIFQERNTKNELQKIFEANDEFSFSCLDCSRVRWGNSRATCNFYTYSANSDIHAGSTDADIHATNGHPHSDSADIDPHSTGYE
jgi:hypothetical protein